LRAPAPAAPPEARGLRVAAPAAVFALRFVTSLFGLFGGGDVKMLSALVLFVPVSTLALFAYVFSAAMLAGMAAILLLRRLPAAQRLGWKSSSGSTGVPMRLSSAMAGLAHPAAATFLGV